MEKTLAPKDLRAVIVSVDLLRSSPKESHNFNSNEFLDLAQSAGLKIENHIFSKQNFVSASHFITKGKVEELKTLVA